MGDGLGGGGVYSGGDVMERHSDTPTAFEGEWLGVIFWGFV